MKHIAEHNQHEKSIPCEMLNLYPLCMAEVYQNGHSIFKHLKICLCYLLITLII